MRWNFYLSYFIRAIIKYTGIRKWISSEKFKYYIYFVRMWCYFLCGDYLVLGMRNRIRVVLESPQSAEIIIVVILSSTGFAKNCNKYEVLLCPYFLTLVDMKISQTEFFSCIAMCRWRQYFINSIIIPHACKQLHCAMYSFEGLHTTMTILRGARNVSWILKSFPFLERIFKITRIFGIYIEIFNIY